MLPTLAAGQLVLFVARSAQVGDIVMVRHDGLEKIKRIARLEHGRVYLLGDNPQASTDSRDFGWLGQETIRGVLYWPKQRSTV
jgi:phage repressor protein C with HTH and peptisase S24 domain